MDQTNKYILMCEEATEIQKLRHYPKLSNWQELNELNSYSLDFDEGDFIAFNSNSYNGVNIWVYPDPVHEGEIKTIKCWLPRQDQLQEMCKYQNSQILLYAFVKFSGLYIKPDKTFGGMSYEQLWLAFVMHEKYNKTWVDNCWVVLNEEE